ncbi:hypothetical protein [Lachnospira multipara]|uniref:hypothetical protein n=1 Tax=Lachnospira multipara TaxID=28051 RepID=UPI0004E0CCC0|nr:hypothetical protein [Lachnospira multipara]
MNKLMGKFRQLVTLGLVLIIVMSQLVEFKTDVSAKAPTEQDIGKLYPMTDINSGDDNIGLFGEEIVNVKNYFEFSSYVTGVNEDDYTYEINVVANALDIAKFTDFNVIFKGKINENFEFVNGSEKINGATIISENLGSITASSSNRLQGKFKINESSRIRFSFQVKAKDSAMDKVLRGGETAIFYDMTYRYTYENAVGTPVINVVGKNYTVNKINLPAFRTVVVNYYKDKVSDEKDEDGNYKYYLGTDDTTYANMKVGSTINKSDIEYSGKFVPYGYQDTGFIDDNNVRTIEVVEDDDKNVVNVVYKYREYTGYTIVYNYNDNGELRFINAKSNMIYVGDKLPFNDNLADPNNDIDYNRPEGYTGKVEITKSDNYTGYAQSGSENKVVVVYNKPEEKPEGVNIQIAQNIFEFYGYYTPVEGEDYTYDVTYMINPLDMEKYLGINLNLKEIIGEDFELVEGSEKIDDVSTPGIIKVNDSKFSYDIGFNKYQKKLSFRLKAKEDSIEKLNKGGNFLLAATEMSYYGGYYLKTPNSPDYTAGVILDPGLYLKLDPVAKEENPADIKPEEEATKDDTKQSETEQTTKEQDTTEQGEIAADTATVLPSPTTKDTVALSDEVKSPVIEDAGEVAADTSNTGDKQQMALVVLVLILSALVIVATKRHEIKEI